jgi:hypothetical protein
VLRDFAIEGRRAEARVGVDVPRVLKRVAEARDGVVQRSGFRTDLLG